jgi:hypothetical protein
MASRIHFYPKGTPIVFTEGEYSDFGLCGSIVTIQDCDMKKIVKEYLAQGVGASQDNYWISTIEPSGLVAHMIANGLAMPMNVEEVHLGGYGGFDCEFTMEEN